MTRRSLAGAAGMHHVNPSPGALEQRLPSAELPSDAGARIALVRVVLLAVSLLALVTYSSRALAAPPPGECASSEDCDDGDLCNGAERCVGPEGQGRCISGLPPRCSDRDPCTSDACVDNECVHEPIPDCPDSTTTTTTSTTTSSSIVSPTSTSATVPSTTHSTTTSHPTTTTSTTMPEQACTAADPQRCDDGDPCTVDSCSAAGTCTQSPLIGVQSVACICERALPSACQPPLPRRLTRLVVRGCTQASRAASRPVPRQGVLLRRAGRTFARAAARTLGAGRSHVLDPACADPLTAVLRDAVARAQAAGAPR